jgi:integrase
MSVHRRKDKWIAKIWSDGRWRWVGTFSTRKEARAAEQAASPARGISWNITVEQFCELWLRDYARPASSSQSSYRYAIARLRDDFGSRRLGSIERPEALSEDEVGRLADCALKVYDEHLGPTIRALILTAGFVGLRPAELAQLDWGDVDLNRALLHVRHAGGGKGERKSPKTEAGRRICVLPPPARDALADLERHEGLQAVFLTPRGRRFNKGSFHRYFVAVRAAFGRPDLTPYELRHACATLLLERGLSPEDVAAQLGHKDGGQLVRRLYGHPDEQRQRERIALAFAEIPAEPVADRLHGG